MDGQQKKGPHESPVNHYLTGQKVDGIRAFRIVFYIKVLERSRGLGREWRRTRGWRLKMFFKI